MYCGCQAGLPRHERHSALFSSLVSSSSAPETPACRNLVIQQNKQKKPIKHTLIPDLGCLALPSRDVSCCTLKNAVSLHPKESCAAFWKTYLFRRNKLHRLHSALERNYLHRQLRKSNHCYNKLHWSEQVYGTVAAFQQHSTSCTINGREILMLVGKKNKKKGDNWIPPSNAKQYLFAGKLP